MRMYIDPPYHGWAVAESETTIGVRDGTTDRERAAEELVRGDGVGRYLILGAVGRGDMGVVYAAYDPELDRKIALKLLSTRPGDEGASHPGSRRMLREAQAMARLNHPNVVTVHDVSHKPVSGAVVSGFWDGSDFGNLYHDAQRTMQAHLQQAQSQYDFRVLYGCFREWLGDDRQSRKIILDLPPGNYSFEIERGPEYRDQSGYFTMESGASDNKVVEMRRFVKMKRKGGGPAISTSTARRKTSNC